MKITSDVHLIEGTEGSFSYLVMGQEPILVDTSMRGRTRVIVSALDQLGMKPTDIAHIVLTHQDVDHIGNAAELKSLSGATLWAPAPEIPYIQGQERASGVRGLIGRLMPVARPQVDKPIAPGERIGGLEAIPAPGHTAGHFCLRAGDVLLAGDLVTTRRGKLRRAPRMLTSEPRALRQSLRDVGRLPFAWVCPAHGLPVARGSLWEALLGK